MFQRASKRRKSSDMDLDSELHLLHGACLCERNQYAIVIPSDAAARAQVFFDNSAAHRRAQASPVTAWLRVPLDWFQSCTIAQFPDESHGSIRRTYHTPSARAAVPPTRRQFCGYCGTHLTAWNEAVEEDRDYMDVTLGSLLSESLEKLETLGLVASEGEDDGDEDEAEVQEEQVALAVGPGSVASESMQHRGIPYFEEMVEDSRLGRIKRRKGGHASRDGRTMVQWEVIEIDGSDEVRSENNESAANERKRQKMA